MSSKTYEYDVAMSCSGCSGAIERVLKKWQTTYPELTYVVSLETQKVQVTTDLPYDTVFEKINKVKPISGGREVEVA
ncbi:Cytosolic copper metallochaperone [Orbilia oligospora]|nr:Cytosolic copper metallochaperone [Orbilia oligospora]